MLGEPELDELAGGGCAQPLCPVAGVQRPARGLASRAGMLACDDRHYRSWPSVVSVYCQVRAGFA